jgi:glycerophosphoryl diester phosphodiesterase
MESFEHAVEMGVDGIETDIRITIDGVPILFHDRVSLNQREVNSLTQQELSDIMGYSVPTLRTALERIPDILWNLEIKAPDAVEPVKSIINRFKVSRRLMITSFWHNVVEEFSHLTTVECGILIAQRPFDDSSILNLLPEQKKIKTIVWDFDMLDASILQSAKEFGIRNFVYGAATINEHRYLTEIGVDGIITDYPEFVVKEIPNAKRTFNL